ncbi:MAG: hypothetical protein ACE5IC_05090 [Candidatus Brocadiales bacterium]
MCNYRLHFYLAIMFLINGLLSSSVFSETYVINGSLEKRGQKIYTGNSIVRKESLIIRDERLYIQVILDEGARRLAEFNHKRHKEMLYVLPEEVVYDSVSKRVFYYKGNTEIEIGREKSFLGFMPYIALAEGVKIISSPTDAKLLISVNRDSQGVPISGMYSEGDMEATLSKKCGQCHILEYIYTHKKWVEEDILHAFNRMQMEEEQFTENEQEIIDLFKEYQRGAIDKRALAEFKLLKEIGKKDVTDFTQGVYTNNCVPCHNPLEISDVSLLYSKRRCKSIVERMKEKEPSLFLHADMDRLASYLWETKLRPKRSAIE